MSSFALFGLIIITTTVYALVLGLYVWYKKGNSLKIISKSPWKRHQITGVGPGHQFGHFPLIHRSNSWRIYGIDYWLVFHLKENYLIDVHLWNCHSQLPPGNFCLPQKVANSILHFNDQNNMKTDFSFIFFSFFFFKSQVENILNFNLPRKNHFWLQNRKWSENYTHAHE